MNYFIVKSKSLRYERHFYKVINKIVVSLVSANIDKHSGKAYNLFWDGRVRGGRK